MGRLFIPSEKKISGPWMMSHESLESLDKMFSEINEKLTTALTRFIEKTAKQQLEEDGKNISLEERIAKLNNSYSSRTKTAIVTFSDGSAYGKSQDIKGIINYVDSTPSQSSKELRISTRIGSSENKFEMVINTEENELEYRIHCIDEDIQTSVKTEIDKWIRTYQPKKVIKIWSNTIANLILLGCGVTIFVSSFYLTDEITKTNESDNYKTQLHKETRDIIKKGVSNENINQAVSILLKLQSDYVPDNLKIETIDVPNRTARTTFTISLILFIAALFKPLTVIGIGVNQTKLLRYRAYIAITGFLLISVIGLLISYFTGWLFHI